MQRLLHNSFLHQVDDRHAAEKEMRRRDKDELRRAGRIPRALDQGSSDESSDGERISARDKKKKLRALEAAGEDELADTNLEEIGNPNLKEVISGFAFAVDRLGSGCVCDSFVCQ